MAEINENLKHLKLLISIIPDGKKEIVTDLLDDFGVNFSYTTLGKGTLSHDVIEMLGLHNNNREIVFSFIREDKVKDALLALEDKFKKFKQNQSIAFSVPLSGIIGMQNYLFLSNLGGEFIG